MSERRNVFRWLSAWTLYWIGDAISRPMDRFDLGWLYPAYNRVMVLSCQLQGQGNFGPWKDAPRKEGE